MRGEMGEGGIYVCIEKSYMGHVICTGFKEEKGGEEGRRVVYL